MEVVEEGENGFVFSYEDPIKAIFLIDTIINKDNKWLNKASELSKSKANEMYHSENNVKRIIQELELFIQTEKCN